MSLNGLDDPKVREAHEAAAAEPGGWFLLKYASRDEVDLLARGNGGIVEMRNNIAQYEEKSPLFGFLRYRRRNVIIKYLPEDCSRLIQARVTVHFNAVCEKFTPYNTLFSISTAKELKDTKLSAACSLHAASGSTSSSTSSLRGRRLMEIAEEEEEEQRSNKRKSAVPEDDMEHEDDAPAVPSDTPPQSPEPPVTLNSELAASPEERRFSPSSDPPDFVGAARPISPTQSIDNGRPMSSQTARPELYGYSNYTYGKPKVKLAPRPSIDVSGRPKTAGNFRPVSQMPAGFKLYSKGSKRQKSRDEDVLEAPQDDLSSHVAFGPSSNGPSDSHSISLGEDLTKLHTDSIRPATSSGASAKSPTMSSFPGSARPTMTPEKARLMKAMQLREKKKMMMSTQPVETTGSPDAPPGNTEDGNFDGAGNDDARPAEQFGTTVDNGLEPLSEEDERRLSMAKLDSGVVADVFSTSLPTDPSESTRSDSGPASPLILSSEPDQSTKASSLSESTDETVQETQPRKELDGIEDANPNTGEDQTTPALSDTAVVIMNEDESPNAQQTEEKQGATDDRDSEEKAGASEPVQDEPSKEVEAPQQGSDNGTTEISLTHLTPELPSDAAVTPAVALSGSSADEENKTEEAVSNQVDSTPDSPQRASKFAIPKSKFSTHDSNNSTAPTFDLRMTAPNAVEDDAPGAASSLVIDADTGEEAVLSKPSKHKVAVEPIRTDLAATNRRPISRLSDDEDLMNELQSAPVEQAQPLLVSKSPVTPVFPTRQAVEGVGGMQSGKEAAPRTVVRTISNPVRGSFLAPTDVSQSSARSVSSGAAYLHKITQQQTSSHQKNLAKSGKLGSNISQRIKALEKLSSSSDKDASPRGGVPSSTFFAVRKTSTRDPSRSPSLVDRASSLTRGSPTRSVISESRDGSPELRVPRERSGSVASRLSMFEVPLVPPAHTMPRGQPESVSVTARIIRDSSQVGKAAPPPKDPSEFSRLDLKVSPLEVNHQKATPPGLAPAFDAVEASPSRETIRERRMSKEKRRSQSMDPAGGDSDVKSRRSSLSVVRGFIKDRRKSLTSASTDVLAAPGLASPAQSPSRPSSTNHSNSSFPRRLSISSRRSSVSRDGGTPAMSPSMFTEGSASGDDSKSTNSDKKKGRAGRFMRRLSSSFASSRNKNLAPTTISPTVHEEDLPEVAATNPRSNQQQQQAQPQQPSVVSYMGDVNVQFPDNLLWKRRAMCLDSQGFLILSASTATAPSRDKLAGAGVKRYHLSEFRNPYTPDVEVQELPNSVVLDFLEGSGLQIACEDRAGQMNVLHILQEAHQNHTSFGQ
ncbi:hypothetical protein SODALDRAFT_7869 [Sodiomyces alkalinus F11]|uniref:ADF-H domain-containing protein n=1 Tax=Sodiomyces alkalinus (strain CBS 110278 / VKM F-3762 / F11) TaxID=1314773 RepID=A0A3N2Q5V2_SODAK|nr:hypothetical protein SODALDRAFT_7869 [Sodiomyces alkalinus F11]ROT42120.1 hypothetical protein SODALDRAFT_7869 [Sodiomyces alkalinus F11]